MSARSWACLRVRLGRFEAYPPLALSIGQAPGLTGRQAHPLQGPRHTDSFAVLPTSLLVLILRADPDDVARLGRRGLGEGPEGWLPQERKHRSPRRTA